MAASAGRSLILATLVLPAAPFVPITSWRSITRQNLGLGWEQRTGVPAACVPRAARRRAGQHVLKASSKVADKPASEVINEMEKWAKEVTPPGHEKRDDVKYVISPAKDITSVLADFWRAMTDVIDQQRSLDETRAFRSLVMFVAPYCSDLLDYDIFRSLDHHLQQSKAHGCKDFGGPISVQNYHPDWQKREDNQPPARHSPYPSFSIAAMYRSGGYTPLQQQALSFATPPAVRSPGPLPEQMGWSWDPEHNPEHKARLDKWALDARAVLERAFNKAAAPTLDDQLVTHGARDGRIPENTHMILEATQRWVEDAVSTALKKNSTGLPGAEVAKRLSEVTRYTVVRSRAAENVYTDLWEGVADMVKRAGRLSCNVPFHANMGVGAPCYSLVMVLPDFSTFNAAAFLTFVQKLNTALEALPTEDYVTLQAFHPEVVQDLDAHPDDLQLWRSPFPTLHIRYEGARNKPSLDKPWLAFAPRKEPPNQPPGPAGGQPDGKKS